MRPAEPGARPCGRGPVGSSARAPSPRRRPAHRPGSRGVRFWRRPAWHCSSRLARRRRHGRRDARRCRCFSVRQPARGAFRTGCRRHPGRPRCNGRWLSPPRRRRSTRPGSRLSRGACRCSCGGRSPGSARTGAAGSRAGRATREAESPGLVGRPRGSRAGCTGRVVSPHRPGSRVRGRDAPATRSRGLPPGRSRTGSVDRRVGSRSVTPARVVPRRAGAGRRSRPRGGSTRWWDRERARSARRSRRASGAHARSSTFRSPSRRSGRSAASRPPYRT